MAIFSDLELERILHEKRDFLTDPDYSYEDKLKDNAKDVKDARDKLVNGAKSNFNQNVSNLRNKRDKNSKTKFTFKKDKDGNITEGYIAGQDQEVYNEGFFKNKRKKKDDIEDITRDLKVTGKVEIEKKKQNIEQNPNKAVYGAVGNVVGSTTAGPIGGFIGKKAGESIGKKIDKEIKDHKESFDYNNVIRSKEYVKVMNEFFDKTDNETRKVLLAVNEEDQTKVISSLTAKLYENVIDKVDDIDFGEIPLTRGDITKLSNFDNMNKCLVNIEQILLEFKQDVKPARTIMIAIDNIINTKDIWTKAYATNIELPMITYNTIVLAIIESTSYLVAMAIEFIKTPSKDTMQVVIDKSGLTKSKDHMIFKNLESFNEACRKGQVQKAMNHVIETNLSKKNFVSLGTIGVGATIGGIIGLLFCIIPIIRELIFLFYYNRVRVSEFFEQQADILQINSYNVENNRLDLTKEERTNISKKQLKVAEKFRKFSDFLAVKFKDSENKAVKDIKKETQKKYKADEIMDELPDSASSALF